MAERRSQYEIYWEILTFYKAGKLFTGIINLCNLNSKTGQEHLEFLTGKGLPYRDKRRGENDLYRD
jgi:predicted transcriptional regulator